MNEKKDVIFADGMIVKRPSDKAPDFVVASVNIKASEFVDWLNQHQKGGWVNVDILESRNGKYYAKLNTFEPSRQEEYQRGTEQAREAIRDEKPENYFIDQDIPFSEVPF